MSVSTEPAVHRAASVGPVLGRVCQVWICEEERPPPPNHTGARVPSHDCFEEPSGWALISAGCGRNLRSLDEEVGCDPGP